MKITVVSTTTYPCPPQGYGGEVFFWLLARTFGEKGHEVDLIAPPLSKTPPNGRLLRIPSSYGNIDFDAEFKAWEWYSDEIVKSDFILDCSHNHLVSEWMWLCNPEEHWKLVNVVNGCVTFTPRIGPKKYVVGSNSWKERMVKGLSDFAGTPWEKKYGRYVYPKISEKDIVAVIYWAVDTEMYSYYEDAGVEKEDFILWLARPTPYKGWKEAIEIAKRNNVRLVLMTGIGNKEHEKNFKLLKAEADKNGLEVIVNPTHKQKIEMYQKAKALLYPVQYNECFGLVVVEALACGTPVIASNYGAMPELIKNGETGYICRTDDDFIRAIENAEGLNPEKCRKDVMERFSPGVCAENYLKLYRRLRR